MGLSKNGMELLKMAWNCEKLHGIAKNGMGLQTMA
jgi:hypothetical protein